MIRTRILPFITWLAVSLWSRSLRVAIVNSEVRERVGGQGKNFIYAFWHGSMFLLLHANRHSGVLIPVSESSDGDIMARVLQWFRFRVVRGSSSRNGHKALLGMISGVKTGGTVGVAVDGPRGPVHQAKKGAAYLAGRMGIPIIPVAAAAQRCWILHSTWEKLMLPVPFSKGVIVFGDPITVEGGSDEAIESGRRKLEQALRSLSLKTRELAAEIDGAGEPESTYASMIADTGRKQ